MRFPTARTKGEAEMRTAKRIAFSLACSLLMWGQAPATTHAHVIVTAGHYYSHEAPKITGQELIVLQGFEPRAIAALTPLREDSPLELYVLVDDCSSCEAGTKFDELRRFVLLQPATTLVGVAYIEHGQLKLVEKPSEKRERALAALNPPTGGRPANPFVPLKNLIQAWDRDPARNPQARRAILMISNGIDPNAEGAMLNPSADAAIEAAQRGDVTIFVLYHPSSDYAATDSAQIYAGQVQLSHVANESGGEAYMMGFGPLPSLAPFLADVADHLANQYRLDFLAVPGSAGGSLENILIKCAEPDVELMAPARAWIPGSRDASKGQ